MKNILVSICLFMLIFGSFSPVFALNVGTYKTDSEYGLFDGFKFNWKRQDKSKPFVEPRESSTPKEYEKEYKYYQESEYERTKYMYDGKAIF